MKERTDLRERQAVLLLWGAVALGVALRLLVFRGSGFPSDVGTFMAWAERMASVGPAHFYAPDYFSDYPPAFLYVLWLVGALFDGEALRLVVKLLSVPADIAIAYLLFRVIRPPAGATAAALGGALWMLQPGPIFAGPFWGQVDSWGTLPFLAALIAAGGRRWALAGILAGIAGMVKPQFGLAAAIVGGAALFELVRGGRWRPLLEVTGSGLATAILLGLPFGLTPGKFVDLVRFAAETYPYTSLYAFNVWSLVGDFWKPDALYVLPGALLLAAGILGSVAAVWPRRDTAALLAAGAFAAMAFYFLPTRAHERYLFPVFALLVPFAVTRARILWPYLVLALGFFVSLYFAFTRYPQNGLTAPGLLESTFFSRSGQIVLALAMVGSAALLVWRLVRGEARLDPDVELARQTALPLPGLERRPFSLPDGLRLGRAPTRRDVALALMVALAVVATRGFRLDQPRDMYFDEVYHARTAIELLAQRDPYEWTHPHLAKEVMALGIAAFGGDRVEATEPAPSGATAFAVAGDGTRAYGFDGQVLVPAQDTPYFARGLATGEPRATAARILPVAGTVRALAFSGSDLYAATDGSLIFVADSYRGIAVTVPLASGPPTSLVAVGGRVIVGTASGIEIYGSPDAPALRVPIPTAAATGGPGPDDLFVADLTGAIHLVDLASGADKSVMSGGAPATALAWAQGPQRLYAARRGEAALDWYEPPRTEDGASKPGTYGGSVELSNARTGELSGPISALALVPRTQFLYALVGDPSRAERLTGEGAAERGSDLVVIETHGASPFAAVRVHGTRIGIDGTGDRLEVIGERSLELVPTGRHAFAWRLPGVLAAGLLAFFVVLIARRLFASPAAPLIAGLAVILDTSMFAQARIGMNDIYVATFLVAGWYFAIAAHAPRRSALLDLALAGVMFGLAAASKWVALYALAGLGVYSVAVTAWAWSRGRPGHGGPFDLLAGRGRNAATLFACFFAIPLALYLASYISWFGGKTIPYGWNLVELTQQMYWYHSSLTAPHPAGSPWWSWPLVLKPVYWYLGSPGDDQTAVIYDAGNVVLFWGGISAFGWALVAAIRARSWSLGILVFAVLTQYVAWIPITRVLFFYHFFTALPFYLLILAAALAALWERGRRQLVTGFLTLAAAAFVFFYPFVSGQPIDAAGASAYYILPTWQYDCQFYPSFTCPAAFRSDIPLQAVALRILPVLALLAFTLFAISDAGRGTLARARSWAGRSRAR